MIRCRLNFQPLNFYAQFVAPTGVDTQALRHALYSDAAEPETLPPAPVLLCLLPRDAQTLPADFFDGILRLSREKAAAPVFAVDVADLSREELARAAD